MNMTTFTLGTPDSPTHALRQRILETTGPQQDDAVCAYEQHIQEQLALLDNPESTRAAA